MKELVRNVGEGDNRLQHFMCWPPTVFDEAASTRISCSFQAVMQQWGGTVVHAAGREQERQRLGENDTKYLVHI